MEVTSRDLSAVYSCGYLRFLIKYNLQAIVHYSIMIIVLIFSGKHNYTATASYTMYGLIMVRVMMMLQL